jgi:hypothetical protein
VFFFSVLLRCTPAEVAMSFSRLFSRWVLACTLGVLLASSTSAEAAGLLRRTPGSWVLGPRSVWTNNDNTTLIFHPIGDPMSAVGLVRVRVAFQLSEISGTCRARPALRFSDDGSIWDDSSQAIDTTSLNWQTTNTIVYSATYVDLTALTGPKGWVQFGVQTQNVSPNTTLSLCNATLRVEPKDN